MKFPFKYILLVLLPFVLTACSSESEAAFAEVQARVVSVNTANVQLSDISSELSFAGRVRAEDHIAVIGRLPGGMVDAVFADVGDFVNAGDILFVMDAVDIQTNVNALTAQLAAAEAGVNAARTGVAQADGAMIQQQILAATSGVAQAEMALAQTQASIEQAVLGLTHAETTYNTARTAYENTRVLYDAGVVARTQMEQAEIGLSGATIGLEQARNGYNLAQLALQQAQTGHSQALQSYSLITTEMPAETVQRAQDGLAQAIAQRDSLIVNLQAVTERLDDATVRAPISGVIGSRNVEPRTMLMPGLPPFTIVSAETITVGVEVTEVIINQIHPGQEVTVHITAAAAEPFTGTVATVSPAANEMTSTFSIEISVDNSHGLIRPGMFAEVFFVRESADNTVVIPRSAAILTDVGYVVFLAQDGRAVQREVSVGIDTGTQIQITQGLSPNDPLIVTGQQFLIDGVQVLVVESF
ncbi:MAG: efflux RND transporter periplasmic adaptor subunit [Defluviitaleaceae bacterium]|nr:efflux RND transporter periplasmic adaptor subunit [Defluviitaleaceae bacterium]MCL2224923.1 efflux RND transporter periplasmic adaptor subunit [Defluviitaleaceae bacterium]MCL2262515.1 efflux RND transporter periplasmic adaptor subunit [Defluviitaleaceae bacterium]